MSAAVYLDWNASAPLHPAARAAWLRAVEELPGNPSAAHVLGRSARGAFEAARRRCAELLGCRPHELILTSGGSESNALAVHAALSGGGSALVSAIEHSSVLRNIERLPAVELHRAPVDEHGRIDRVAWVDALHDSLDVVCLQFANNELGTVQDLTALLAPVRERAPRARILLDCCQGAGKRPLALAALDIDFASIAGHKFGAPRGLGLLYVRSGVAVPPLIAGGRQQDDRRSGTEDVAGFQALCAALEAALASYPAEAERQSALLAGCFARLQKQLPELRWIAHDADRLAGTMSLAHPGVDAEALVTRLDLAGFAVSRGAACMAPSGRPSHVIAALGLPARYVDGVIRVSIGRTTSAEELDAFAAAYLRDVTAMLSP